jgi:arylsulfatase A-like enzyme/Tfp pilus assembly protein PilF
MSGALNQKKTLLCRKCILPVFGLVIVAAGIWLFQRSSFGPEGIRNVLLISIDTCRADYLGCYGYQHKTTPNIDAIAKQSIVFENVISPIPLTLPAHASMLTGTIPPYHGVHDNFDYWLDDSHVTLAEILKGHGFATGAVVSAFVLDSKFGIKQGFDSYHHDFGEEPAGGRAKERKGQETSSLAVKWLEKHKADRFFLFVHYYDPHRQYDPPEPFASQFADNLYAGEIAYTDYCIARVIQKLKDLGLFDSTLVVITSDHGEMLGEHGESDHGYFIYQSAIKVPLIIKMPGKHKSRVVRQLAGLIDIVPTICSLLGVQPPPQAQGTDLSDYFTEEGSAKEERYIYAESLFGTKYNANSLLGVVTNRWKYIQTTRPELYDVIEDPQESNNLTDKLPRRAHLMRERLRETLEQTIRENQSDSRAQLDSESIKRLESLGYVGGKVSESFEFDQSREDPKDSIGFHSSNLKLSSLIRRKRYDQAKNLCHELLSQRPDYYGVYTYLSIMAFAEGDEEKAEMYTLKSLGLNPDQIGLHNSLGKMLAKQGRYDRAIWHLTESVRLNPNQVRPHFALGTIFEKQERLDEAVKCYADVLVVSPQSAEAHNNLSSVLARQAKYEEAFEHSTMALEINPNLPEAYYNLGNIMFQQGEFGKAVIQYEKALMLRPDWEQARMNLMIAKSRKEEQ